MERYILIDANSGFIFGDTLDPWWRLGESMPTDPIDAVKSLDRSLLIDNDEFEYGETSRHDPFATFYVYRSGDSFPHIQDGQDQGLIDAVCRDCLFLAAIYRRRPN